MTTAPPPHPMIEILTRETAVHYAEVPRRLGEVEVVPGRCALSNDAFLLVTDTGLAYHYRRGYGVAIERSEGFDPGEESLWLNGSVNAAIASIHGLLPIH